MVKTRADRGWNKNKEGKDQEIEEEEKKEGQEGRDGETGRNEEGLSRQTWINKLADE